MNAATLRLAASIGVTALLLATLVGLARPAPSFSPVRSIPVAAPGVEHLLTAEHRAVATFLASGRAGGGASGPGLFSTDFFKPAPPPPPKPKPPAPTTREIPVSYRGLAAFPSGSVAFLTVEGKELTLAVGDAVAGGWRLDAFDAEQAALVRDDERRNLPARRPAKLVVPAAPPP